MSTEFQAHRKDPARGILLVSSPASAGQDLGVSRPPEHLTSQDRTDATGRPSNNGNADGDIPFPTTGGCPGHRAWTEAWRNFQRRSGE